jgi:hypothetical protein
MIDVDPSIDQQSAHPPVTGGPVNGIAPSSAATATITLSSVWT